MSTWTKAGTAVCLVLILALAACLRVTAVTDTTVLFPIRADAADYAFYALNLRYDGIYSRQNPFDTESPQPDAVRSPGAFWSWNIVNGPGSIFVYEVLATPFVDNRLFESIYLFMKHTHGVVLGLSLFAAVMIWTPGMQEHMDDSRLFTARLCVFVLIYFTGLHMIGAPFPRYSIPLRPLL